MAEIPVYLRSRGRPKFVSGVTENTSCFDVLSSVIMAEAEGEVNAEDYVLVEQWRGVERPLAGASKVLRLWQAWGDERAYVRFVVKRVKSKKTRTGKSPGGGFESPVVGMSMPENFAACNSAPNPTSTSSRQPRRLRRRNSLSSNASDTMHPRKIMQQQQQHNKCLDTSQNVEDMMKEIMRQGRMICRELTRIDPRLTSSSTLAVFGPESSPMGRSSNNNVSSSGADAEDEDDDAARRRTRQQQQQPNHKSKSPQSASTLQSTPVFPPSSSSSTKLDYYYDRRKRRGEEGGDACGSGGGCGGISGGDLPNGNDGAGGMSQVERRGEGMSSDNRVVVADIHNTQQQDDDVEEEGNEEEAMLWLEIERTRSLVSELAKLSLVNEELHSVETKCHILHANLQQFYMQRSKEKDGMEDEQLRRARSAVAVLRQSNERADGDIRANAGALEGLGARRAEQRDALKRLEYEVNVVEKEGRRLGKEYEKVISIQVPEITEEHDEALADKSRVIYSELKELQLETQRLRSIQQQEEEEVSIEAKEAKRVLANGSPEGSSSGASSGADDSAASGSSLCVSDSPAKSSSSNSNGKSVRFLDDSVIAEKRDTKDEDDGDNSDTGLSSLHSGSGDDEVAARANTARAMAAAVKNEEPGAFTLDFGTLV